MDIYVLDTNLFFNMEPGLGLGRKTEEVVVAATAGMKRLREAKQAEFYMPPRVVEEFTSFFDDKEQPFIKDFFAQVTIKSPNIGKAMLPSSVFYELVSDIRLRSYRGLTIAEEELTKAVTTVGGEATESKKDLQMKVGPFVKTLRDRYRQATRVGFLDSVADLDLIVLADELGGYLVSTDEGVMKWGRLFGVKEKEASVFGKLLAG